MTDPQAQRRLAALVAAAYADGQLADSEKRILYRKAAELKIPLEVLSELLVKGGKGQLTVQVPSGREARLALLGELIELVCSDGRVEATEQQILSRVAQQIGIGGPDLRERIKREMDKRDRGAGPSPPAYAPASPALSPPVLSAVPAPPGAPAERPPLPPGPIRMEEPKFLPPSVAEIPPVTLQLLKQAISFENLEGAILSTVRILTVPRAEAERVVSAILAVFPELLPATRDRAGRRP